LFFICLTRRKKTKKRGGRREKKGRQFRGGRRLRKEIKAREIITMPLSTSHRASIGRGGRGLCGENTDRESTGGKEKKKGMF